MGSERHCIDQTWTIWLIRCQITEFSLWVLKQFKTGTVQTLYMYIRQLSNYISCSALTLGCQTPGAVPAKKTREIMGKLLWGNNGRHGLSNHQPRDCSLNCSLRRRSKKTSKLRVIGLCEGNSPVTGEFPAQMVSNADNVSLLRRHHGM